MEFQGWERSNDLRDVIFSLERSAFPVPISKFFQPEALSVAKGGKAGSGSGLDQVMRGNKFEDSLDTSGLAPESCHITEFD